MAGNTLLQQLVRGRVLEQVAQRPGLDGRKHLVVLGKAGEHQDPSRGVLLLDLLDRLNPTLPGPDHVHQADIGLE
jgi:hypothetical protein